ARMALGIAAFQAGGLITNVGTMAHVLELAVAARDGIQAAELAEMGCTAHSDIIETSQGFCNALVEEGSYNLDNMVENFGASFQIIDPGISIKKYPCCYRAHCALDALFDLLSELNVTYNDIEKVVVDINPYDSYLMKFSEPKTAEESKFSFPHILGSAILNGQVWVDSFNDKIIMEPKYREARKKIEVNIHHEWSPGRAEARTPITLIMKDGRVFSKEVDTPREPSLNKLLDRYRQASDGILSKEQMEKSIDLLMNFKNIKNISELMILLGLNE
ncbi:MAG: MmgE/PrpD family protein, partial [Promethearchaeota archaeon]